jgi:hypothetical protein
MQSKAAHLLRLSCSGTAGKEGGEIVGTLCTSCEVFAIVSGPVSRSTLGVDDSSRSKIAKEFYRAGDGKNFDEHFRCYRASIGISFSTGECDKCLTAVTPSAPHKRRSV